MARKTKKKFKLSRKINARLKARGKSTKLSVGLSTESSHGYVLTSQGEIDILSRYILDYPKIETGGQLFGYWTFDGNPVVLFVLGPGPDARHYNTFFMQDLDYLRERAKLLKSVYGLDHIGEWHSHHQLGLSRPSGHDSNNIATNMRKLGYYKFLLCIGTCTNTESMINAYMFESSKSDYYNVPWLVKDMISPFRTRILENEGDYFTMPHQNIANMVNLYTTGSISKPKPVDYDNTYWLKKQGNSNILKSILDFLRASDDQLNFSPALDDKNQVHIQAYQNGDILFDIHFSVHFPIMPPRIISQAGIFDDTTFWNYDVDIFKSFVSYYKTYIQRYKS